MHTVFHFYRYICQYLIFKQGMNPYQGAALYLSLFSVDLFHNSGYENE